MKKDFYPFGKEHENSDLITSTNRYTFSGKEKQTIRDLGWLDFSARMFANCEVPLFTTPDPLMEKYYSISPYAYCANNPLKFIDPNGMNYDWVQNMQTDEYEWMDNVTYYENTPEGYKYVGANDNDILTDMGVNTQYETKNDLSIGGGFVSGGDKNVGPAGQGIPGGAVAKVKGSITISPIVSSNETNATENNKSGKIFEGISITAHVSERVVSSSPDLNTKSGGHLSVFLGNNEYKSRLQTPTGQYIFEAGTKPTVATINIPAHKFSSTDYLQNATINIGRPNPGLIINPPTKISWGLQTIMMFRPAK
ncbi:MAG: hypothetical protein LBJ63_08940 [Prevotellaceae bacterium]|jgi:RHS repeat-associated protein|nr:hypothetical protein [Prevotellaceae bacterium]